jgi:hypothetical protein
MPVLDKWVLPILNVVSLFLLSSLLDMISAFLFILECLQKLTYDIEISQYVPRAVYRVGSGILGG